ncbi:MAG: hypothetical protein IK090_04030 [Clostridia bacterium]|nr:hypothetical protein [Clostridia bacterium]
MNGIAIFNALTKIDDRFIDRAAASPAPVPAVQTKPRRSVRRWVEIAACACLLLTVALVCFSRVGLFAPKGAKMKGGGDYYSDQTSAQQTAAGTDHWAPPEPNYDYSLSVVDGRNYLNFDGGNGTAYSDTARGSVNFQTVEAMVKAIRMNAFSAADCELIRSTFPRNENGILVFDLDHVYDAVLPDALTVDAVNWEGPSYSFEFNDRVSAEGYLRVLTQEDFAAVYDAEYTRYFDDVEITVLSRENVTERNAEVVSFETPDGSFRQIRYVLSNGVTVAETYLVEGGMPFDVPETIDLYGADTAAAFTAHIAGLTERPSVEWLSRFGVREH